MNFRKNPLPYYHNQQEEYYGFRRDNPISKSKKNYSQNRNIAETDLSKQYAVSTSNANNNNSNSKIKNSRRKFSKAQSQSGSVPNSTFYSSSNIMERIQKACTTNSVADLRKQNSLLKKQLQKLQKQCLRKDKLILSTKNDVMPAKQNQGEILELYRVIHFYQGRVKQMQQQIIKLRNIVIKANVDQQPQNNRLSNQLFDQLMRQNEHLHGEIEEYLFQKQLVEDKYKKLESKYHELHRQLCQHRRRQRDPLNKNNSVRGNYMYQLLKKNEPNIQDKQYYYKLQSNMQTISELEDRVEKYQAQNGVMAAQIQDKNNQITAMHKQYISMKKSYKSLKSIADIQNMQMGSGSIAQINTDNNMGNIGNRKIQPVK